MPKYLKIKLAEGGSYIQPQSEIHNAIDSEIDGLEIGESIIVQITAIEMSEDEYEKLHEFTGH